MNEDLLLAIWKNEGFEAKGIGFDKFKTDINNPELQKAIYTNAGFADKGKTLEQFQGDLGVGGSTQNGQAQAQAPAPKSFLQPSITSNPGAGNEKLDDFYSGQGDLAKADEQNRKEEKAAELLNQPGTALDNAKSIYTQLGNKEAEYSKDPQIADAEFSFEALNHYKENAQTVYQRSMDRLGLLYGDRYQKPEIEKAVNTYTTLSLMGKVEDAQKYIQKYPEIASDPNLNNVFAANQRLREAALAEDNVIKSNPRWLERQQKIAEKQKEIDKSVTDYRAGNSFIESAANIIDGAVLFQPNVGQAIKARIGTWAKNIAGLPEKFVKYSSPAGYIASKLGLSGNSGPGLRDFGRDMMDFNPVSSDYQGHVIENVKSTQGHDLVYEDGKLAYIRDSETGFIVKPTDKEVKALESDAKDTPLRIRINPKPLIEQTANVALDMAPIIAITAATGGIGSAIGLSVNAAENIGVVAGSALQMRGDIMDQMLLHPDITPLEAEIYTDAIGMGIGFISLINPIEKRLLQNGIPGILRGNFDKLLNSQITKGQLAWNVIKDVGVAFGAEPVEENLQDWFQYGATLGIDQKEGYGRFTNPMPTGKSMLETTLVTAAAGLLGGAGQIRTQRTQFIDDALDHALSQPKVVDQYFSKLEEAASNIDDEEKKNAETDRIGRLKQRWADLQANTSSIKGLKGAKRGQLAALLLDSNALEEEAKGIPNKDLRKIKEDELKDVNQQITDLIAGKVPVSTFATPPGIPAVDTNERDLVDNAGQLTDKSVDANVDYFEHGQAVEHDGKTGTITDVHENADRSAHAVDIKYDDGTTARINVFRKTPQETGIKVVGEKVPIENTPIIPNDATGRDIAGNYLYNIHRYTTKQLAQLLDEARTFVKNNPSDNHVGDINRAIANLEKGVEKDLKLQAIAEKSGRQFTDTGTWNSPSYVDAPAKDQLGTVTTSSNLWDMIFKSNGKMKPFTGAETLYFNSGGEGQLARSRMMHPDKQGGAINLIFDKNDLSKQGIEPDKTGGEVTITKEVPLTALFPEAKLKAKDAILNEAEYRGIELSKEQLKQIDEALGIDDATPPSGPAATPSPDTTPAPTTEDPHVQAEIDREHVRLIKKRDSELQAVDQLTNLYPEYPADVEKAKINARYEQGVKDATFTAKKAFILRKKTTEIAKVKELGKTGGVDVSLPIANIEKKANEAIAELEKQYKPKKEGKPKAEEKAPAPKAEEKAPAEPKPETTPKQEDKPTPKTKTTQKLDDIDSEIDDIFNHFKKLSVAVTPEQQAEDARLAVRLINLYIQKGFYTIKGIIEDMLNRMDAETAERILPHVKKGYLAAQSEVDEDVFDKMDDTKSVRAITVKDVIKTQTNDKGNETEKADDTTGAERDTPTIIADTKDAIKEADAARSIEEIRDSLDALESAIEQAVSKIGHLTSVYNTEGIEHELPNTVIGKNAKKEITKYAKEIARLTGWEAGHMSANIAPAGGDVSFTLAIPKTPLSVYVSIKYDPDYRGDYDNYKLSQFFYRIERTKTEKGQSQFVGTNQFAQGNFTAKEFALTLFNEAKPYISNQLQEPVELPEALKPQTLLKPVKIPRNGKNSGTRTRKDSPELDRPHQDFQQGLLYGTEEQQLPGENSGDEGGRVSPEDGGAGSNGEISTGGSGGSSTSVSVPEQGVLGDEIPAKNFHFPNDHKDPTTFNTRGRFETNLIALRTLKTLLTEKRNATPQEQETLVKYVGWGGIKVVLNSESTTWSKADEPMRPMVAELKELITELEQLLGTNNILRSIKSSALNAHYTGISVIRSMYSILYRMGFTGGKILEPSAGIGNFLGAMPGIMAGNSKLFSVEKEPLTGAILSKLYPKAISTVQGYESVKFPDNNFDLIISNIPFGDYNVAVDQKAQTVLKRAAQRIHNYFFVRALDQVKEGGLMAFITTSGTMDTKGNDFVRQHINQNADFLGAIRLPNTAFKGVADTSVVTDIIFIRKNTIGEKNNPAFHNLIPVQVKHKDSGEDVTINVNEYFINNPDHVIGKYAAGGLHGRNDMTVIAEKNTDVAAEINKLESNFPENVYSPQNISQDTNASTDTESDAPQPDRNYYIDSNGNPAINQDGEPINIPKTHLSKVIPLIKLRDALKKQYALELSPHADESEVEANRKELNSLYDEYVKKHKFLHTARKFITQDDFGHNIIGLENYNKETKATTKADILKKRSLNRIRLAESADTMDDAIGVSINETGKVDLARIAQLMGLDLESAFDQGYGLFYQEADGRLVTKSEYLSGNVKKKLAQAKELAKKDPLFEKNVAALIPVIPKDLNHFQIKVPFGARWVPTKVYQDFIKELFGANDAVVTYSRATDEFSVSGTETAESRAKYGVLGKKTGYDLAEAAMAGKIPVIKELIDKGPPRKERVLQKETDEARRKYDEINKNFEKWLWQDEGRQESLSKIYNDRYNTTIKRQVDGTNLYIDGLQNITLRQHQKDAIMMIFLNQGGIIDHEVGLGKTAVMIGAAIKMKQTGVANKPAIIALKSTLAHITSDANKFFPTARILAPSEKDFKAPYRKALLARIQNNDWDLIIMSHEQFKFIPQDPEFESQIIYEEIAQVEAEMEAMMQQKGGKADKKASTKLQKKIENLRVKLGKVQARVSKDTELMTFKEIGIDHIFVDESQQYKNLTYSTRINDVAGLGNPAGSDRSFNLLAAIRSLQAMHNGDKGTTFLSGTPISNSLVEMYLLLKYLRPDKMKEIGYDTFDAWVRNSARQSNELEFTVMGTVKSKNRFREFINLPELSILYTEIADVRNAENTPIDRPTIKGGEAKIVAVDQSKEQKRFTRRLIKFAKQSHGDRDGHLVGLGTLTEGQQKSAMLLVTMLSTKAAIDMRLVDPRAKLNPNGKLAAVANQVYEDYKASDDIKGTQLIFCDTGTPKSGKLKEDLRDYMSDQLNVPQDDLDEIFGTTESPKKSLTAKQIQDSLMEMYGYSEQEVQDIFATSKRESLTGFNTYNEMKRILVEKGIPPEEVVFIHSYNSTIQKENLFAAVNAGKIRVVIGSTQKLGTGVNAQERIVSLHHVDAQWNPASMTQRNGRGIRQGNMNKEVAIYKYGTKQTLDTYKYQLIAAKQKFIDQVKVGASGQREYSDKDGEDLSAQEIVAILSGNRKLLESAQNIVKIEKLNREKESFAAEQYSLKRQITYAEGEKDRMIRSVEKMDADLATIKANSTVGTGEKLVPTEVIEGKTPKDSKERTAMMDKITDRMKVKAEKMVLDPAGKRKLNRDIVNYSEKVGTVSGLDLIARISADGWPGDPASLQLNFFLAGQEEYATASASFSPTINRIEETLDARKKDLENKKKDIEKYKSLITNEWGKAAELEKVLLEQADVLKELGSDNSLETLFGVDDDTARAISLIYHAPLTPKEKRNLLDRFLAPTSFFEKPVDVEGLDDKYGDYTPEVLPEEVVDWAKAIAEKTREELGDEAPVDSEGLPLPVQVDLNDITFPEREAVLQPVFDIADVLSRKKDGPQFSLDAPLTQHTSTVALKQAPGYKEAKSGDALSAAKVIDKVFKAEKSKALAKHPNAIIVPVVGVEESGVNALPSALAYALKQSYGNEVDEEIYMANKPKHTGATMISRMLNRPIFEGKVNPGQEYYLVDDVSSTGSTLAALKGYIEDNGGKVIGTNVLGASTYVQNHRITNLQVRQLSAKFGTGLLKLLQQHGIAERLTDLTNQQAAYLIEKQQSIKTFRDKLIEEYQREASSRVEDIQFQYRTRSQVEQAFPSPDTGPQFSLDAPTVMPDVVNGFYSPLEKIIIDAKADKLPVKQWIEKFAKGEEAKWTGLTDWLGQQEGSVSKSDIQNYLKNNRIKIQEVVKSDESADKEMQRLMTEEGAAQEEFRTITRELNAGDTPYISNNSKTDQTIWVYQKSGDDTEYRVPEKYIDRLNKANEAIDAFKAAESFNDQFDPSTDEMTRYSIYTLPGEKTNYKEVLVTMPLRQEPSVYDIRNTINGRFEVFNKTTGDGIMPSFEKEDQAKELLSKYREGPQRFVTRGNFQSAHWDEPNILVHMRMDTRIDADGNKVLFLEELQSDWGQKGKREGFRDDLATAKEITTYNFARDLRNSWMRYKQGDIDFNEHSDNLKSIKTLAASQNITEDEIQNTIDKYGDFTMRPASKGVASAPYVTDTNAWTKLGLKVAIKEAVNQGVDKIAWTTGEQQADRYDLSKQVGRVSVLKASQPGLYQLVLEDLSGDEIRGYDRSGKEVTPVELSNTIGKDLAEKAIAEADRRAGKTYNDNTWADFTGKGLKVGGEGMTGYYGNPATGKLGILGNVAKSVFGQEVGTTEIDIAAPFTSARYSVYVDDKLYKSFDTREQAESRAGTLRNSGVDAEVRDTKPVQKVTQHSVTITPELRAQVQTTGLPLFSLDATNAATTAINNGNPDKNADIIIHLLDAHATGADSILPYASTWLDLIKEQSQAFYNRGLELIKGTAYDTGDAHADLSKAIADKVYKAPKNPNLIAWVKQFWTRVGKILKLNITPEKLQSLTVDEYLDIASTQLKFGNDIYTSLIQDGAHVPDNAIPQGPPPIPTKKPVDKNKALEDMFDAVEAAPITPVAPSAKPTPLTQEKHFEFQSRDLNAKGTVFANPKGPSSERLLREYSGNARKVVESLVLLFPSLKAAGITTVIHENQDSYANAVTENGGTPAQAMGSSGFYRNSQIHINLSKPNLKANVALHEAFHPIIREILVKDKPAFQRFINDILADPEMRVKYKDAFAQAYAHLDTDGISEEILVEASADTVLARMLKNMADMPDSLFDRVLQYIKKALGETYGALMQFIDTKQSFAAWANSMADAISKGMVVPINPEMHDNIRTVIQESKDRAGNLFGGSQQGSLFDLVNNSEPTLKQEKATPEALLNQKYFDLGYPAPNGKKSNLTPKQYAQVRTPEFKAWFGDWENDPANASKVVDENGEPQVVYHATNSSFSTFSSIYGVGYGHYFTPDKQYAQYFLDTHRATREGKPSIMGTFLNARDPLRIIPPITHSSVDKYRFSQMFKEENFDAITGIESVNGYPKGPEVVVVFEPNQIKSATDNSGAFDSNNPNINFSLDFDSRKRQIRADLDLNIVTNPDANWEKIVGGLKDKGWFDKYEVDDILGTWRNAKMLNLNKDQTLDLLLDMAELQRLHRMDDYDSRKMNQQSMRDFVTGFESGEETFLERLPKYIVQELVEDVAASGDAHPSYVIEELEKRNNQKSPSGSPDPSGAGPRLLVAASVAMSELRKAIRSYKKQYDTTGDLDAYENILTAEKGLSRLVSAVYLNRSVSGASLGIGSKLIKLAGLTYESEIARLEAINKAGKNIAIDPKDKETIKRLTDEINALKDQQEKDILAANPKKNKAAAAEKEYTRKMSSSLESRPSITKAKAIELLRRRRASGASFSLAFSLDAPELSYEDIINELVKNIHQEITDENTAARAKDPKAPLIGGFKTVVSRIQAIDSSITEDDIYKAILSTTPRAKNKALSEYAKIQALTRKHVKDINKVEDLLRKYAGELLRKNTPPSESQMAEFGKLLQDIEKNIYQMDVNTDLYSKWLNALQSIRDGYKLAFLNPVPTKETEIMLGRILNSASILKDAKFHKWLESRNAKVQAEIDLINAGRVSELIDQEDKSYRKFPDEMLQLDYNPDGSVRMISVDDLDENGLPKFELDESGKPKLDAAGNKIKKKKLVPATKSVKYNFGQIERMIKDKEAEKEKAINKYRKVSGWDKFLKGIMLTKNTFGSSMAMADVSVVLNQGFKATITGGFLQPKILGDAFGKSIRAGWDEFKKNPGLAMQFEKAIHDAEFYSHSQQADLKLTNLGQHLYVNEMLGAEDWFDVAQDKIGTRKNITASTARGALKVRQKVKDASNAQFATYLNVIAYGKFHSYMQKVLDATGSLPTPREQQAIASMINAGLGRTGRLPGLVGGAQYFFWAPRLYLSHIINIANIVRDPVEFAYHMAAGNGDLARAYGQRTVNSMVFAASVTALWALTAELAKLICGEHSVQHDASKASWLKIKCGELTLDPTSPVRQWVALGGRILASAEGHPYTDMYGRPVKTPEQIYNALKYKANPLISVGFEEIDYSDFLGRERIPGDESFAHWKSRGLILADNLKPIAGGNLVDIGRAKDVATAGKPLLMAEALLGSNVQYINAEKEAKRKEIEKAISIKKKTQANTDALGSVRKRLGAIEELNGQFQNTSLPIEDMKLTDKHASYDGKSYRVFQLPDDDGDLTNDFYTIKTHKSGANKGKKYLDKISEKNKIH